MYKTFIEHILGRTCYSPLEEGTSSRADLQELKDLSDDKDKDDLKDKDGKTDEDVDDDKIDEDVDDEDKNDEEDEDENTDNDENEDEEDDDEKEEDDKGEEEDRIPSVKELKASYPDIFKKHPELKAAIFRDQKYAEILGTVEQAQLAADRSSILANVEKDLFEGNPEKLLDNIKKNDEKAYKNLAYSLLPYFEKNDRAMYLELSAVPIKQLLRNAYREGNGEKGSLGKAALWIHDFMFGKDSRLDEKISWEGKVKEEKSQEQKDYEKKLADLDTKAYNDFKGSIDNSYVSKMDRFLREGLDKNESLTDWMKDKIVQSTLEEIFEQLSQDTRHSKAMGSLWQQAKSGGYNSDFKSRIINAALARAKSLAPDIRAKMVRRALGKAAKREEKDTKREGKDTKREDRHVRRESNRDSKPNRDKSKPLTDIDILRS